MAISARSRNMLTLYSGKLCLRSHQVRLVLAAKGVTYDLVLVDPARPPEDLIDLNPYQSVPTLVDRDLVLHDVDVVCDYIDERYPHPPLMPVDPSSRARLRMAERRVEWEWLPLVEEIQTGAKAQADKARRHLRDAMTASAPVFKAAKFFLNTEMSIADCLLAPLVWRLPWLGVQLPREAQAIYDYGERIFRNPGFARSLTPDERQLRDLPAT
ncbi:MAG: glutathione S-transferase N-terminal domain-containing protein [Pseudoxanthomonas sp.]|nr:glutathione S-transferase N-terminal domain-containing protein [Pseudoxanthomonas sp.]